MILLYLRFLALYIVLLVLGASLHEASRAYLQSLAESLYGGVDDRFEVNFQPLATPGHPSILRVVIADRSRMDCDDSGPVRNLDLDPSDLLAKPLALSWALILCTPVSWRRRFTALFWSAVWEQFVVLAVLGFFIWNESGQVSLTPWPSIVQAAAAAVRQMIVAQLGLAVPILLWIVVLFRRDDQRNLGAPVLPA